MINPNEINSVPKQFVDSSIFAYGKEIFTVIIGSGDMRLGLVFNPIHFKQVVKSFQTTLEQYENKHGKISEPENQPIPSPIQMDSLGK